MKLFKFFGLTSRAVLEQVRKELGADAMIVSNRPTANGIEITRDGGRRLRHRHGRRARRIRDPAAGGVGRRRNRSTTRGAGRRALGTAEGGRADAGCRTEGRGAQGAGPPPAPAERADGRFTRQLMDEMQAMRGLIEGQFAQLAWSDAVRRQPLRAQFTRELLASGYSAALARQVIARLPDDYSAAEARDWLEGILARNLRCVEVADDIVTHGGVYALVGPTGVGKTTTTAKLAARCAVRYGARALALLTTDSYRIGAQDQLRIYAKILGVAVHTVSDAAELRATLDSLSGKHLVLIDTVGMGQRDQRVAEHSHWLAQPEVKRLLLLNATAQAETLEEVVAAYGATQPAPNPFVGTVITKIDETARPGQVIDVIVRHRLTLQYISNGQRVPEDLHTPNPAYLVHRSLQRLGGDAPPSVFALQDDELAMMLATGGASDHA